MTVASRSPSRLDFLAAAIKRSISALVRYSRVRTEEFTVVGADRPPLRFSTIFCPCAKTTSELSIISSLVSIGAASGGRSAQSPEPIDAGEIDGPVWSVSDRGMAGALDRVAQIPARPFRLGLTRVL